MQSDDRTCLLALAPSGARINVWTDTAAEAEVIAEAFHEARPNWGLSIDGLSAVFSREGKVVHLIDTRRGPLVRANLG
jgi:hypothetical protein